MSPSTILIADDSVSVRDTLSAMLKTEGYTLHLAKDGDEALSMARQVEPDLVLLDVVMPGKSGFEVCSELRADKRLGQVPILILTSLDDRKSKLRGIEAGADDFLIKPFDGDELLLRVRTITRLDRFRKLADERSRFEWVVRRAEEAYLLLDGEDRVVFSNEQARTLFGAPQPADRDEDRDTLSGSSFLSLVEGRFNLEPESLWMRWPGLADEEEGGALYLVRPESPTEQSLWVEVSLFGDYSGPTCFRLVRLKNVTQQMTNQRDIWTFQSMISHKLRTPLSGILFSMDLLASNVSEMGAKEIGDFARTALESAERLHNDFESVLRYLEGDHGQVGEGFVLESLEPLLDGVRKELSLQPFSVDMAPELHSRLLNMSENGMELIMFELLANGRKFHPERDPLMRVEVRDNGRGGAAIRVSDDGPGIAPEKMARVFDPYFQGEKGCTFEVAGMGLGLPMVAHLLWNAGGGCRIANNTEGGGLTVELDVPEVNAGCRETLSP